MAENTNVSKQKDSKDALNNVTAIDIHSSSRGKAKRTPSTKPEAVLPTTSKQNVQKTGSETSRGKGISTFVHYEADSRGSKSYFCRNSIAGKKY